MSRRLLVSVCPPGTSARFWNVPGAGAFGGFDSPAGLWLRLLLLLARDVQSAVPSLRSSVVLRAVPPPLGVRCALFSVFVGVGRSSGVNKIGRLFGGASPSGFAFGLLGFAFGLRLRARPKPRLDSEPMGERPGSFPDSPTHGTPRSYLPRNAAVRRFGAFPVALAVLHLMEP